MKRCFFCGIPATKILDGSPIGAKNKSVCNDHWVFYTLKIELAKHDREQLEKDLNDLSNR